MGNFAPLTINNKISDEQCDLNYVLHKAVQAKLIMHYPMALVSEDITQY